MKKILFFLLAIVFTSCIEIIQEIQLKKNGSGAATYTLDMSKMRDMMEGLKSLGADSSGTDLGDADKQFAGHVEVLKKMEGISNVKMVSKKGVYKISFQFKNIDALNKALTYLNNGKASLTQEPFEYLKVNNKQVIVKNFADLSKFKGQDNTSKVDDAPKEREESPNEMGDVIIQENSPANNDDPDISEEDMMKAFFMDASYTTIVQVYGGIASNSHPNAQVSGKKVTLKIPLLELDKAENVQNIITLK